MSRFLIHTARVPDMTNPNLSRRRFSTLTGATLAAAATATTAASSPQSAAPAPAPQVRTQFGPIRGSLDQTIAVFKGVPYGAPTGGSNRFKPARDPVPWRDVRDTTTYGPAAPQPRTPLFGGGTTSEDCLRLNVWTPGLDSRAKRPVMLWLHGGGFSSLSGSSPAYDGTALCQRGDVVVLTLNHRLNVFGFLHLAELLGPEWASSGNEGMRDIVHALKWVRRNIRRFGGDPNNVTLFGESGGGRKVATLMGMPAATGLFHKAIIQSGPGIHLQPADKATDVAAALLAELGVTPVAIKANPAVLQSKSPEAILAAYGKVDSGFDNNARSKGRFEQRGFVPTVGTQDLPHYAFDPVASEYSQNVPLLIGTNRHEMALFFARDPKIANRTLTEAELAARVAGIVGPAKDRVLDVYATAYPTTSPAERWTLMITDRTYRADSITLAQRKAKQGPATYMYYFTWESRTTPSMQAHHALEIPFVFENLDKNPWSGTSAEAQALAVKMSESWLAFAKTGNPNNVAIPAWPEYQPNDPENPRATMEFNDQCRVRNDPDFAIRTLWATV